MTTINPYLTFKGDCEQAFDFYKSIFGTEYQHKGKYKDMPASADFPISESDKEKILHISLLISKETVIYGCDSSASFEKNVVAGNNFSISIETDTLEETNRIFKELSEGGKITMPLGKTFWEAYFGMFTDKFGINWMINYDLSKSKN